MGEKLSKTTTTNHQHQTSLENNYLARSDVIAEEQDGLKLKFQDDISNRDEGETLSESCDEQGIVDNQEKKQRRKKKDVAIAGTTSAVTTGAGIAMMIIGGPIGIIAGGIILGAGVSGAISTTQQALNKNQDQFDYKRWGMQSSIGAAGGAIAAPISVAGSAIAGGAGGAIIGSASAKVGIIVGADVAGGLAAGAGTKMLSNAYEGKQLSEGVLQQAVIMGVTGGLASTAGLGASQILKEVSDNTGKIIIHTTTGALVSGTSGGLGCLLHNVMEKNKIDKKQFTDFLQKCGATQIVANEVWSELESRGYLVSNQFTQLCEQGIFLGDSQTDISGLGAHSAVVNEIYQLTKDIWRGVWQSAAESAALGGVITGMVTSTRIMRHQQGRLVNRPVRRYVLKPTARKEETKKEERKDVKSTQSMQEQHKWLVIDHKKQANNQNEENGKGFLLDEDREGEENTQQQPSNQQDIRSPTDCDESYFFINQEDYDLKYVDLRDRLIDCYLNETKVDPSINSSSEINNNGGLTPSS